MTVDDLCQLDFIRTNHTDRDPVVEDLIQAKPIGQLASAIYPGRLSGLVTVGATFNARHWSQCREAKGFTRAATRSGGSMEALGIRGAFLICSSTPGTFCCPINSATVRVGRDYGFFRRNCTN